MQETEERHRNYAGDGREAPLQLALQVLNVLMSQRVFLAELCILTIYCHVLRQ